MSLYSQTWIHLMLFGFWIGTHVAVVALMWQMRFAEGHEEGQKRLTGAMESVERLSRTAFVLMLPMGLQLAENMGLFQLGGMGALGVWIIAIIWLIGLWTQPRGTRTDMAVGLRAAQRVLMVSVGLIMIGTAALSLLNGSPIAHDWLSGKFALYGAALLLVFGIEYVTQPILYSAAGPGLRPTRPLAEAVSIALPKATILSVLLLICLGAASYLGLVQPT